MSIVDKVAEIIARSDVRGDPRVAAQEIINSDAVQGHFEQKVANEQVRRLREDYRCPTCGADA